MPLPRRPVGTEAPPAEATTDEPRQLTEAEIKGWMERKALLLELQRKEIDGALAKLREAMSLMDKLSSPPLRPSTSEELERWCAAQESQASGTHYERIADFLRDATMPRTMADIEFATDIPRTSISAVLYRTHRSKFKQMAPVVEAGRAKASRWVLLDSDLGRRLFPPDKEGDDIPF